MFDMKEAMKDLRLAQRLLFSSIQNLSTDMTDLRKFGEDIGIFFPVSAPARKGANLPRTGGMVPDLLDYESYENVFPFSKRSLWRILNSQIMKVNFLRRYCASTEKVWSRHS